MTRPLPRRTARLAAPLALTAALAVAGCVPPEERAEQHYQDALELVAAGDPARAKVELRNVFDLDGFHRDARDLLAELLIDEGDVSGAYSQTLRLVEQYPQDVEGLRRLALLATQVQRWDDARRYAEDGLALDPEDAGLRAAMAAVSYRDAAQAEDEDAMAAAAQEAGALLAQDPELEPARLVMIDRMGRESRPDAALALVEDGLALDPEDDALVRLRIGLLAQLQDAEGLSTALSAAARQFPDDAALVQTYLRWLTSQGRPEEAEAFLRERAEAGGWTERTTLLAYLRQVRGDAAMRAELDALLADPETERRPLLRAMRAELDFASGDDDAAAAAVSEMRALTEEIDAGESGLGATEQARLHLALARMSRAQGDRVGARAALERALEVDPALADAYKARAVWALEADDPAAAITALRAALGTAPRDPEIMSLMARAHALNGDSNLAGEMLARAVELSNAGADETLRYAEYLLANDRTGPAATVLADARRIAPDDLRLVSAEGRLMVREAEWGRLEALIAELRARETPEAGRLADEFAASALAAQDRGDELAELLTEIAAEGGDAGLGAEVALLRAEIASGDVDSALARSEALLAATPQDARAHLLRGGTLEAAGRPREAEVAYREAVRLEPRADRAWVALYRMTARERGLPAAAEVLDEALGAAPQSAALLFEQAARLERDGRIGDAIDVYERLYEIDRASPVIANNLASLIGMSTEDPQELARAERIARRLRELNVPAFQDTYGWLAFRTGDVETALDYLTRAASGLPDDPFVRHHLARAQAASGLTEAAAQSYAAARRLIDGRLAQGYDVALMADLSEQIAAGEAALAAGEAAPGE